MTSKRTQCQQPGRSGRQTTQAKRSFREAINAFRDPFAVEIIDERTDYGEERINLVGMCHGVILHVTYTERSDRIRLISAQRAEKHEQDHYYSQNAKEWDDR